MSLSKIRISAVSYSNTYPFIYGLSETKFGDKVEITTDHPADCARKLIKGEVDIGLIPSAAIPAVPDARIITDYCLGAYGKVETVLLLSNSPLREIETIHLDYRSISSITLIKILAHFSWGSNFIWKNTDIDFDFLKIPSKEAVVLIGDQCIELSPLFKYKTDLAEEWYNFTGLPFAFACWVSNKELDKEFLVSFNNALAIGINNIPKVVERYGKTGVITGENLMRYLTVNMDFILNNDKRKAIDLFLDYIKKLPDHHFLTYQY